MYALGVVLYEMLCGRPPFEAESSTATALARLTTDPLRPRQVRAGLSRELEDVVLKAMARRPDDRYPTAAALCSALDGLDLRHLDDDDSLDSPTGGFPIARDDTPVPGESPRFTDTERSWIVPAALIVVVAVTLAIVGIAVGGTDVGRSLFDAATGKSTTDATSKPVALHEQPTAFDPPPGSDDEHDDQLPLAVDGNGATAWTTEHYDSRSFGGLKRGIGIVLHLDAPTALARLELDSPTKDWSVEAYVGDGSARSLAAWGPAAATADGISGTVHLDLHGANGSAVLVWITDLGDGTVGEPYSAAIAEARLFAS